MSVTEPACTTTFQTPDTFHPFSEKKNNAEAMIQDKERYFFQQATNDAKLNLGNFLIFISLSKELNHSQPAQISSLAPKLPDFMSQQVVTKVSPPARNLKQLGGKKNTAKAEAKN